MAPLIKELEKHRQKIDTVVAVTAQHREMLDQVLNLFQISPQYDLNIMQRKQSLYDITTRVLLGMKEILEKERPNLVLVHGDTSTTFVAALAAFYQRIPVGHVEAGLRTRNKYSPYPEEMNRRLAGVLADLHFAPTLRAKENLLSENVPPETILVTGNTVIDALLATVKENYSFRGELASIDFTSSKLLLVTAHRRENWGEPMTRILLALKDLVLKFPEVEVIFPVHRNPRVREPAREILGNMARVHLIEPLDYEPFVNLMNKVYLVLTDSGGLQEEAPSLGKPVLVLRDTTERPEALEAGTVKLVGTQRERIISETVRLLQDQDAYQKMANAVNPYGDGKASRRIVEGILYHFKLSPYPPVQFSS